MDPFTLALLGSTASSVVGGGLGALSSQRAAGAQSAAAQQAGILGVIGQQQAQERALAALREAQAKGAGAIESYYGKAAGAYDPYSQFGAESTNRLATLMGLRPGEGAGSLMEQPTLSQLQMDPGYAFREQQGQQAMERAAAAGGLRGSGAALKAGQRFGQEMASQEYGNAYNRFMQNRANIIGMLQGGVGTGMGAAQGVSGAASTAGGQLGSLYSGTGANIAQTTGVNTLAPYAQAMENVGQARASGYMGGATALGQALQAPAQNYMLYSMMNRAPTTRFGSYGPQL